MKAFNAARNEDSPFDKSWQERKCRHPHAGHSDPPICLSTLRWAGTLARARRSARARAPRQGICTRGARTRAQSSRRRWLPARRLAGPLHLAQGKARHVLGKFAIFCIEPLELNQPSVGRPYPHGRKGNDFVNVHPQVPFSEKIDLIDRVLKVQYFKGDWT